MSNSAQTAVPTLSLRGAGASSVQIPQLGFGVWQVPDEEAPAAVTSALEAGYRSIDTAAIYGNENGVGQALAATDVPRSDIFLTTKLWNADQGYDATLAAFDVSAAKLGSEVPLDLYLIHWPAPEKDAFVESYRALQQLREDGRVRAIGVCNFNIDHLERLNDELGEYPAINQIELHPLLQQAELRAFHAEHDIVTEAWSPLAQGGSVLEDATIAEIAQKVGRTPAQVILRWHLQLGNVAIPKSVTPSRIQANFAVFDFELGAEDLAAIAGLDQGKRLGPDPLAVN